MCNTSKCQGRPEKITGDLFYIISINHTQQGRIRRISQGRVNGNTVPYSVEPQSFLKTYSIFNTYALF